MCYTRKWCVLNEMFADSPCPSKNILKYNALRQSLRDGPGPVFVEFVIPGRRRLFQTYFSQTRICLYKWFHWLYSFLLILHFMNPLSFGTLQNFIKICRQQQFVGLRYHASHSHYNDAIMSMIASQITSVYSTVDLGADQRKHQCSASLAFVRGIHRRPVNSPHKGPVTRKIFPFDDVIM